MTRPLLLSNGHLQVGINLFGMVHDLYYPWVGYENHARAGNMRHRVGVMVDGKFSWFDDGSWQFTMRYQSRTQIGHTTARNDHLEIIVELLDCVAQDDNVFLRNIHIINTTDRDREVKLFMQQAFLISASLNGDTAQFLPNEPAILHFKGRRNFIISGQDQHGKPFDQHAIGLFETDGHEGTFRDAEDGWLSNNEVEFGKVDSVIGFTSHIAPLDSARFEYWLAAGKSQWQALEIHRKVQAETTLPFYSQTQRHWQRWLGPAEKFLIHVQDSNLHNAFRSSLFVLKSHIDHNGAVMASTDTAMLNYRRDSYAYCWPRDASFALWPLLRMGYKSELKHFFTFCRDVLSPDGFLLQKFRPDGAVGSTWLPYVISGRVIPPIQEDETAIVIWLFGEYIAKSKDRALLVEFYSSLVVPAANFMASYIDETTKLPHASYDLWEEKFLTTTYTAATVYGALNAAAKMAERLHKQSDAVRWQTVAEEIQQAAQKLLFNTERGFFYKGFINDQQKGLVYDGTIDASSFYGAFMFDLFPIGSQELITAAQTMATAFAFTDGPTYVQRYERDQYYTTNPTGMGNPWFVTSLWAAEYDMQTGNMARAKKTIEWVRNCMLPTGVLSEQVHPDNSTFASVAPLTWSQAEFLTSIIDLHMYGGAE
ncbi:MAG TPA: glycoside hydrolase family 15 protein [Candidatus Saccharimonas sp.]|nr:glycoside hydrolase family 15 protein [Candidatus Saccharimonas sp.]